MKRVLFVFPTSWDRKQLEACRTAWQQRYEVLYCEPSDEACPSGLDPIAWLDEAEERWGGSIDGVTSSSDYPGATLAAALAARLELPAPSPAAVLRASHKYYSRVAQRESIPEATPRFELVQPGAPLHDLATGYPCFVKPVKGAFSIMSGKVSSAKELRSFLDQPSTREFLTDYVAIFNRLVACFSDFDVDGSAFVAEEFLHGRQVTVEGWVRAGDVRFLGVVDSVLHPEVPSFARFDYPSTCHREVREEMQELARRVVLHLGLDHALFNIEMIHEPARDRLHVLEINPPTLRPVRRPIRQGRRPQRVRGRARARYG